MEETLPVFLEGKVCKGFSRGSKELGIPTANLDDNVVNSLPDDLSNGIYYGLAQVDNSPVYEAASSIGWNPFYKNEKRTFETHIIRTFPNDFYGATLRVILLGYIRPEMNFNSREELIETIQNDISISLRKLKESTYDEFREHSFFMRKVNGVVNGNGIEAPKNEYNMKI